MADSNDPFGGFNPMMVMQILADPESFMEQIEKVSKMICDKFVEEYSEHIREMIREEVGPINDSLNLVLQSTGRFDSLLDAFNDPEKAPKGLLAKLLGNALREQ